MKVGIIGDTHDQIPELKKALSYFKDQNIELLIHSGDWVSAFSLEYYKDIGCPIRGVWGNNNNDPRFQKMAEKLSLDLIIEDTLMVEANGKSIIVAHENEEHFGECDVYVYGHNHKAVVQTIGNVLHINPGTLLHETFPWLRSKPSIVLYDSGTHSATIKWLE